MSMMDVLPDSLTRFTTEANQNVSDWAIPIGQLLLRLLKTRIPSQQSKLSQKDHFGKKLNTFLALFTLSNYPVILVLLIWRLDYG
jgi:hypothetical protein